jgi:prepilin-type N-terminal cleavage/methylation domain-containing protein
MPARATIAEPSSRQGFTLVELMVVLVIIGLLASLTLAGLAGVRLRAKVDKTKSTIRKIHELVVPHYEGLVRRRVSMKPPVTGPTIQFERLRRIRTLAMFEMPDSWQDVAVSGTTNSGELPSSAIIPSYAWNGVTRGYGAYQQAILAQSGPGFRTTYPSSECLYMIVSRGLGEPDVMEQFRADEIGDVDQDGAPEFIDGWRRPIAFMRWPIGLVSAIQPVPPIPPGPDDPHDPFDPLRLEANAFPLTPLIYSAGPDGDNENGYGVERLDAWHVIAMSEIFGAETSNSQKPGQPTIGIPDAADNITNHDLLAK